MRALCRLRPRMSTTDGGGIRRAIGIRRSEHSPDSFGNRADAVRIDQTRSELRKHLDQRRIRRHDDRRPAAQRLERRQSEALGQRRHHECRRCTVDGRKVSLGNVVEHAHPLQLERRTIGQDIPADTPIDRATGQDQLDAVICHANDAPRIHQARQILTARGHRQRQHVSARESEPQHRSLGYRSLDRPKLRADPAGNDRDTLRWHPEHAYDLIACVLRYGREAHASARQRSLKQSIPSAKGVRMIFGKAVRKHVVQRHQLSRHANRTSVAWRPERCAMQTGERRQVALLPGVAPQAPDPARKGGELVGYPRVARCRDERLVVVCGQGTRHLERVTLNTRERLAQEPSVDEHARRARVARVRRGHALRAPTAGVAPSTRGAVASDGQTAQ